MKYKNKILLGLGAAFMLAAQSKAAIVEVDSGFGSLPSDAVSAINLIEGDIFGGDGIPSDTLTWKTLDTDGDDIADLVMGMSATQRFQSPTVTNNGVNSYNSLPGESSPGLAFWNFNYILGALDGSDIADLFVQNGGPLSISLSYELDPNTTEQATLAANLFPIDPLVPSILQFSQNLGFNYLSVATPGFTSGAALDNGETFNPLATGTYSFTSTISDGNSSNSISMDVVVEASSPGIIAMFGLALAGLFRLRKA